MPFFCIHCKSEIDPKFKACPFCGEAITDFLRRYLEQPIDGKYKILSRLGVGGMGEVYKVLHVHLNSIRVIKLMRSAISNDAGAHERFLREARLATKIHHSSVATLFDFATLDDGTHYMVWEYIEGINLHELIDQRGPLSPRYAAQLAQQALLGLDAIHRAGIVHRDVSPENLMITRDDEGEERVKIIDLGIAKGLGTDDNKTKTGMFVGKWKYCSPEHLGMLPPGERIDGRADLYSFGIVIYEMLTGVPTFQADTPHAYLMMHASERPRALAEANPSVAAPPELEAVIFKALEKDRNKRYATAREFAQALERIAPLLPDAAGAPPPLPATAEVTDEATKAMQRIDVEAPTVLATVETPPPVEEKTLDRVHPPAEEQAPPRGKSMLGIAAVLVVIALLGGVTWMFTQKRADVPAAQKIVQQSTMTTTAVPAAPGHLGINAWPWATVTSIRNLENGETVDLGGSMVTPAPIDLAPGRYQVTLENPKFGKPITRTIAVSEGAEQTLTVHFADPASAALPDFAGGAR